MMTSWTQKGFFAVILAGVMLTAPAFAERFSPDHRKHVIADPRSGLALFGYDPVGYHAEGRALVGKQAFELMKNGLLWRFSTDANRAVFDANPEVYIPRFGGHDGERVGSGILAFGDPELFLMVNGEVVFFRNAQNRLKFAEDAALRQKAEQSWPEVVRQQAAH
ncbi:MAG: YHS domain-containing (seleno)protein [Beijerinckiaceae bacterium]